MSDLEFLLQSKKSQVLVQAEAFATFKDHVLNQSGNMPMVMTKYYDGFHRTIESSYVGKSQLYRWVLIDTEQRLPS